MNNIANIQPNSPSINIQPKLPNITKEEYRDKITKLYNSINKITPIDNNINNVIYTQKGIEKGLLVKANINALRQMWTEYRLLYNELQTKEKIPPQEVSKGKTNINERRYNMTDNESYVLSNFDEIFDELNKKVDGVNGIIGQLNEMKHKISSTNLVLNANKKSFELYMQEERSKLEKEKEELNLLKEAQEKKIKEEKEKISMHYKKISELVSKMNTQMDKPFLRRKRKFFYYYFF